MRKLLNWLDQNLLKILIGFLIAFIPLWPKKPLIDIPHTWVYIRLEDIFIALAFAWGLSLFFRKRISLKTPITLPIFLYWIAGALSLVFTLAFTAKHLANFFPNVAVFHYLRRIEYLGIFFLAFSSVKSIKDLKNYLWIIVLTLVGVVFYGFGQKILGFPAFLTMNEEFAKGVPLYLSPTSRLTSTFAGHYDLAAYLVLMIAFLAAIFFGIKNILGKLAIFFVVFLSLILLLLTASRVSFLVYLIAISLSLSWSGKKKIIIPVILVSILLMSLVSGASERFLKTLRVRQVVYDAETGKAIGTLEQVPEGSIKKEEKIYVPITTETQETLPVGSGFINLPQDMDQVPEATTIATIKRPVLRSLKMSTISAEIATISGSFLIKKALVYDISFTTRIQGEWPRAIEAFKRNPIFGSGFSSIGLSTDNDYLRLLAESGVLGAITFLSILLIIGIFLKNSIISEQNSLIKSTGIGLSAGLVGIMINASLIDLFEASKVAFTIWLLCGITVGALTLSLKTKIDYFQEFKILLKKIEKFLISDIAIFAYFITFCFLIFKSSQKIYFIGDDFTWLKWAAEVNTKFFYNFFTDAKNFFYRPLAKSLYYVLYNFFWLEPQGYHFLSIFIHGINSFLVYLISKRLIGKKIIALLAAISFVLLAIHGENLFWTPASLEMIAPLFGILSFFFYISDKKALASLSFFLALLGHEGMTVFILIPVIYDIIYQKEKDKKVYLLFSLFLIFYLELRFLAHAHWLSGDYSYNLVKLPQNIIGNFLAYLSGIIFGPSALSLFEQIRGSLKSKSIPILISLIIISIISFQIIRLLFKNEKIKRSVFTFLTIAIFVSLIPYLGLGNASDRYAYFASIWAVILLAALLNSLVDKFQKQKLLLVSTGIAFLLFVFWNYKELRKNEKEWETAGEITYKTLASLRNNFLPLPKGSNFYISNLPIRYGRAWIFPVGFEDGVWHLFKDKTLTIKKISSIEEGLELQRNNPNSYVFTFENYEIKEVR